MNYCLIGAMIVVVTFVILYGKTARKTRSNQEILILEKGLLKGGLVSLGLLVLPIFGSLAFPKVQPNLSAVIFVLELAGIMIFGLVELRKLKYRMEKLVCLLALLAGIALVWWQLFSYYQMDRDFFGSLGFIMATFPTWLLAIVTVVFTYLGGPKLRAKKKSKAEAENAKLREQIERMQNQQNKLQEDNEKLRSVVQGTKSGTPEQKSVTEDKKAESNPPKNTQTDEAQTTTSVPKSDAEDKIRVEVTNPSMTEVQQQKLSEILNQLSSNSSPEAQQKAIEEIVKNYRSATVKEATTPEEETSSQEPKITYFEIPYEEDEEEEPEERDHDLEEEEEFLDPVGGDENWEDDTIFTDLFAKINPVTIALVLGIIIVFYGIIRVVL